MTDLAWKVLLFIKDFTAQGHDRLFWFADGQLTETTALDVVSFNGAVVCHDFWLIRDLLHDETGNLPRTIIDLDELRITTSGDPDDRQSREKLDITEYLLPYGASPKACSTYRRMFNRGVDFDPDITREIAMAISRMYLALCDQAVANSEWTRFLEIEVPVYRLVQKAMSVGIRIDATELSEKRRQAEHDYFYALKIYSAKHDMALETPSTSAIEERLVQSGFDLSGVSTDYVLEFLPHADRFGEDTLELQEYDATRRVLSSLTLSSDLARPVVDVFGSRTSRIHLRTPQLQNIRKKYRTIIAARPKLKLCYVDFDQYEVGIMAALSKDPELSALYSEGDMYELFATKNLGLVGNRKAAKQLFLSYAYGMSRKALIDAAVSLGAERERAKAAFRIFVKYEDWKKGIWKEFEQQGKISTINGNHFRRTRAGQLSSKEQRSAVSQVVQGTASLIFKKALLEVSKLTDVAIILPMHDALLFEHKHAATPNQVVAAFEKVMSEQLSNHIRGKASIGRFVET